MDWCNLRGRLARTISLGPIYVLALFFSCLSVSSHQMTQHQGPDSKLATYSRTSQLLEPQGKTMFILYKLPSWWHSIIAAENGLRQHITEETNSTLSMLNPDKTAPEQVCWLVPSTLGITKPRMEQLEFIWMTQSCASLQECGFMKQLDNLL